MEITAVQEQLDALFRCGDYARVEPFLLQHIAAAEAAGDKAAALGLLNELMGYYRSTSRFADSLTVADRALALTEALGLRNSLPYATTLLNVATAWRADGQTQRAIQSFEEVGRLFLALRVQDAGLVATLYNNLALAWQESGDHTQAVRYLEAALPLVRARAGAEHDVAVSLTNLALSLIRLGQPAEARSALQEALPCSTHCRNPAATPAPLSRHSPRSATAKATSPRRCSATSTPWPRSKAVTGAMQRMPM